MKAIGEKIDLEPFETRKMVSSIRVTREGGGT